MATGLGLGTSATVLFIASGMFTAGGAMADIHEHAQQGMLNAKTVAIDVAQVAASLAGAGMAGFGKLTVTGLKTAQTGTALTGNLAKLAVVGDRLYRPLHLASITAEGLQLAVFTVEAAQQYGELEDLPPGQKEAAISRLVTNLLVTGGLMFLSVRGDIKDINAGRDVHLEVDGKSVKFAVEEVGKGGRHANWVEVTDVRSKILNRKLHVLEIEEIKTGRGGQRGFTGCHSKGALDDYVSKNPGHSYELRSKNINTSSGVYEANPVIKSPNGDEFVKLNNRGKSTFFPDSWSESKILDEVEYAITNNHGRYIGGTSNEYYGFSRDGKVEIHFYLSSEGNIASYFPFKTN